MLELDGITLSLGGRTVLAGLNASAAPGELTLLLGENGSGKTTLFNCLCGLLKIESGTVVYDSDIVSPGSADFNSWTSFIRDDGGTIPLLTVEEQLVLQCRLHGLQGDEISRRITEILELLDMSDYRNYRADELSAGVRKKTGIALGLAAGSRIFLFDEPFSSLDYNASSRLINIIRLLKERGRIIILSTHNPAPVKPLTDRIWFLRDGLIRETVSTENIDAFFKSNSAGGFESGGGQLSWID